MGVGLWVALDVSGRVEAESWMERLEPHRQFKIGLELFVNAGPEAVARWVGSGREIFLDLKLHDIPNTVAGAVRAAAGLGVSLLTVHAAGGSAMLRAAVAAGDGRVTLAAVTVLTSLSAEETVALGVPEPAVWAPRLAGLAVSSGVPAVVAAAEEVAALKRQWPALRVVVPGIRLAGGDRHDQARVADPAEAVARGADDLVLGRAVLRAPDPLAALQAVREAVADGLARRA
jgi:orotidine-5'-phosphate decarboxylase